MKLHPGDKVDVLTPCVAVFPFPADFPRPPVITDVSNNRQERTLLVIVASVYAVAIGVVDGETKAGSRYRMGVQFGQLPPRFSAKDRQEQIYRHIAGRTIEKIRAERNGAGVVLELSGDKLVLVNKGGVMVTE